MVEIGYLAACQDFYHKLVANVSIFDRHMTRVKERMEMEHFVGAFIILGIGLTLATISFVTEMLTQRFGTTRTANKM